MHTPRRSRHAFVLVLAVTVALAAAAAATAERLGGTPAAEAQAWRSAFEPRGRLELGDRVVVVLAAPSLADQAAAGGLPTPGAQRRFSHEAERLQRRLVTALRRQGVKIRRDLVFTRVLNGFSARVDARALAALERAPGVAGIYPVRAVYPAGLSAAAAATMDPEAAPLTLPGSDGSGVTVALLDGGVDRSHPALAGRVLHGVDLVGRDADPSPARRPGSEGELETHGTRMAGLIVGRGGETGVDGVAPGARILPIRILGWQRGVDGEQYLAGRGDVLLAGLERAVDPDGDGDVEDAAQIALAAVVEPYASFPDSPETRAVEGAAALGTLVVAAAGNDGPGGPGGAGTVGAPAGAPSALAVGAADLRSALAAVRLTVRAGGELLADAQVELLGGVAPDAALTVPVTALHGATLSDPARPVSDRASGTLAGDFKAVDGSSLVAGKAVVLPADGLALRPRLERAARTGARAVLLYGSLLRAGSLGLDERTALPTVAVPARLESRIDAALAAGKAVTVTLDRSGAGAANDTAGRVAAFSSGGPTFDGRPKPDVVAPGIELLTTDPGRSADGSPRYAVVSGTSAAAAVTAGAAALVAGARPELGASALHAVLVGSAGPLVGDRPQPATAQGAGLVDPVAADAAELVVEPSSVALGRHTQGGWTAVVPVTVRNISIRTTSVSFGVAVDVETDDPPAFSADPASAVLGPGEQATVRLVVAAGGQGPGPRTLSGVVVVSPVGGPVARVPWVATVAAPGGPLVGDVALSVPSIRPAKAGGEPATVLSFRAGIVDTGDGGTVVEPVGRLDLELWRGSERLGVIARLRDLLPGRYAVGIAGRGPDGRMLPAGTYTLVLRAEAAAPSEGSADAQTVSVPLVIEPRPR